VEDNSKMSRKDFIIETWNDLRWKGVQDSSVYFTLNDGTKIPVQAWADDARSTYVLLTNDEVVRFFDYDDVNNISDPQKVTLSFHRKRNESLSPMQIEEIARKWIEDERLNETSEEGEQLVRSLIDLLQSVRKQ